MSRQNNDARLVGEEKVEMEKAKRSPPSPSPQVRRGQVRVRQDGVQGYGGRERQTWYGTVRYGKGIIWGLAVGLAWSRRKCVVSRGAGGDMKKFEGEDRGEGAFPSPLHHPPPATLRTRDSRGRIDMVDPVL